MVDRFDFVFSFWIFVWYVFYELRLVSYNPKGILFISLAINLIGVGFMFYYLYSYILSFCVLMLLMKIIPLWRVWSTPYRMKDVYATFILAGIYFLWMLVNQQNPLDVPQQQFQKIKQDKPIGPISSMWASFSLKA
jgi:hypothetical protein